MCEGGFWKHYGFQERSDPNFSSSCGEILLFQSPALSPFSPAHQTWHWAESQALVLLQDVVLVDMRALVSSCVLKERKICRVQVDANGNGLFCIINLENYSFFSGLCLLFGLPQDRWNMLFKTSNKITNLHWMCRIYWATGETIINTPPSASLVRKWLQQGSSCIQLWACGCLAEVWTLCVPTCTSQGLTALGPGGLRCSP